MASLGSLAQGLFGGETFDPTALNAQALQASQSPLAQESLEEEQERLRRRREEGAPQLAGPAQASEQRGIQPSQVQAAQVQRVRDDRGQVEAERRLSSLGGALLQQAGGQGGPSAAEAQLQQSTEANIRAAQAQAASQLGLSPAQQARIATQAGTQANLQAGQQAAQLRAQEQQSAQELAARTLQERAGLGLEGRGQDIGLNVAQAGFQQEAATLGAQLQQQAQIETQALQQAAEQFNISNQQATDIANLQAQFQQQGLDDTAAAQQIATQLGIDANQVQAFQNAAQTQIQAQQAAAQQQQANIGTLTGGLQAGGQFIGGVAGGAASIASMFSDRDLKKNVKDADKEIDDFLAGLDPKSFEYIDEVLGKGRRTGIMAQDAEKTPLGGLMVMETPVGKAIDPGAALGMLLASQARIADRLQKLEGK